MSRWWEQDNEAARTLAEKVWDAHVVRPVRAGRARPALRRPAPGSRGHQPAGVRRPARRRPQGAPAGSHDRDRGPQHPDRQPAPDRRSGVPDADRGAAAQLCRVRRPAAHPLGDAEQGIVHVLGPQLGLTQPGMTIVCGDSHTVHARRVRRAGVRHRHQRGRARARHPDAAAGATEDDGGERRRRAAARRDREGPRPRADRPGRHRRRPRPRRGIPRRGDPRRCPWRAA